MSWSSSSVATHKSLADGTAQSGEWPKSPGGGVRRPLARTDGVDLVSEVFPSHVRDRGVTIATAINWFAAWAVAQTFSRW
jgi:hypothetical protein